MVHSLPNNVHLGKVQLAPHLLLMGLGGSVPGHQHGQHKWDGFPYQHENEMAGNLTYLVDPVFFTDPPSLGPEDSVLFMTHNGPAEVCEFKWLSGVSLV